MAAYVGSWYEVYYQNGVNWASNQFKYDDRLSFQIVKSTEKITIKQVT